VDRFMKRLQVRDDRRADAAAREAAKTPLDLPLVDLGLNRRFATTLSENGVVVVQDFLNKLGEGEDSLLELPGIGRKVVADIKKMLRTRGYEVPETANAE
jgi:endonuclease III